MYSVCYTYHVTNIMYFNNRHKLLLKISLNSEYCICKLFLENPPRHLLWVELLGGGEVMGLLVSGGGTRDKEFRDGCQRDG